MDITQRLHAYLKQNHSIELTARQVRRLTKKWRRDIHHEEIMAKRKLKRLKQS